MSVAFKEVCYTNAIRTPVQDAFPSNFVSFPGHPFVIFSVSDVYATWTWDSFPLSSDSAPLMFLVEGRMFDSFSGTSAYTLAINYMEGGYLTTSRGLFISTAFAGTSDYFGFVRSPLAFL